LGFRGEAGKQYDYGKASFGVGGEKVVRGESEAGEPELTSNVPTTSNSNHGESGTSSPSKGGRGKG